MDFEPIPAENLLSSCSENKCTTMKRLIYLLAVDDRFAERPWQAGLNAHDVQYRYDNRRRENN